MPMKNSFFKIIAFVVLAISAPLRAANLTWDAVPTSGAADDGTGNWTSLASNTNWWNGSQNVTWNNTTPDNATFGAGGGTNFTVTVPTTTTNTVGNMAFNANGSGTYNLAAGSSSTSKINLSGTTITVASGVSVTNALVFSGSSFTLLGGGTLVLKPGAANVNSGPTVVGGGTLVIGSTSSRLLIPGDLLITNGATALLGASEQIADTGTVTVNGGTFDSGGKSETIGGFVLDGNGQVLNASSSQAITNNGATFDLRSGTFFPNLAGLAGLTKTTAGTVVLTNGGGADTFSGPVLVSAGILELSHSGTGAGLPGVSVTVTNSGILRLGKDTQINPNATVNINSGTFELNAHNENLTGILLDNGGQILNGGNTSKTLTITNSMDFRNGLCASRLAGTGVLVKSTAGTVTLSLDNANAGGVLVSAGILQLGDGSSTNRGTLGIGSVTNNATIVFNHSGAFTVTNNISGSGSLTNLGGSPTLMGTNTYSGGTTVKAGTLIIANTAASATGSGAVNIQSGATLAGAGIVGGAVNVQSGGTLSPGTGGIGALTINGNIVFSANSTNAFDVNGSTPANDSIAAGGSVTYGGVLNITPVGTFTAGQTFTLFSGAGATSASNFSNISGSPGTGLTFTFTNGILSVVSAVTTPPVLNVAQSGNSLNFSWVGAFKLQSQTNALNTGLNTNWFDYPGGSSSPVNVNIDAAAPAVFFRLSQ
jgi:fibronectin-binding autotransporter adhesin